MDLGAVNETGMVELDHEEEVVVVDVIVCVWVVGLDVLDVPGVLAFLNVLGFL